MISIDLHIHSKASEYKEPSGLVDASDINHVDQLLSKLKDNQIDLFSITDHNRFDSDLYRTLDEKIRFLDQEYPKNIVAGVEFDVLLEEGMRACHIITIFDAKNDPTNYKKISEVINENLLSGKDDFYRRHQFELILKKIGLPVILIAHQKSELNRKKEKHRSLSSSTSDPIGLIYGGYISALEFSRPNQEGILKSNFKEMPKLAPLLTGSDCHQWSAYPAKNAESPSSIRFSKLDILPTFKGLHIAITSPETRIEPKIHKCEYPLVSFSENGRNHPLRNGLIAIIGENGSGKSTFLEFLADRRLAGYQTKIKNDNSLKVGTRRDTLKYRVLKQGEIVENFHKDDLFPPDFFHDVNTDQFEEVYNNYANDLKKSIESRIEYHEAYSTLESKQIELGNFPGSGTFFVSVSIPASFSEVDNIHTAKRAEIERVLRLIKSMASDSYYEDYYDDLKQSIALFERISHTIVKKEKAISDEATVKNIIESNINVYTSKVSRLTTSEDQDKQKYRDSIDGFVESVIKAIKAKAQIKSMPPHPDIISGYSENKKRGFSFTKQADFHERDVLSEFFIAVFNQDYQTETSLESINTKEQLIKAITNCTEPSKIDHHYKKNVNDFISRKKECKGYIIDASRETKSIGNTLGEMSLAYLRYFIQNDDEHPVVFLDQPEDHISNQHISQELIEYFDQIRYEKQVFIVTHNPLLVVNLDVDQVIFLRKTNNRIEFVSGPLEMDDANGNMLEIIASNMDGGREAIKKRMQIYG